MKLTTRIQRKRSSQRTRLSWAVQVGLVTVLAVLPARLTAAKQSDREHLAKLVYAGQFKQAYEFLSDQPGKIVGQDTEALKRALAEYCKLTQLREERRRETYQETVDQARKHLSEGDVEKALAAALKARYYADDEKQFGEHEWVKQIVSKALAVAKKHLDEHEWLKASNIYAELSTIYPDHKEYDEKTEHYAKRARVEMIYKPDSDWQRQLAGIRAMDIIPEVTGRILQYYVESPDWQKLALAGLQAITVFSQVDKLQLVFPSLAEQTKRKAFDERMKQLIEEVKTKDNFVVRNFLQSASLLLAANQDTFELPEELVVREFMDGALDELDKFTSMIWPFETKEFEKYTMGRFSGVGIQITMEKNKLKVITPIYGTPAYRGGVAPGDLIVSINGESTEGIKIDQAVRKITGPKGTKVVLGILHPWADEPVDIPLIRDTIIIHTVKGHRLGPDNKWQYLLDPERKIGYVRITSFTDSTVSDLKEALTEKAKNDLRGLILDLRLNAGGTLPAAVETTDMFLSKGVIVRTKGRRVQEWSAKPGGLFADLPIIVLINKWSASGSEIVCGALKDYGRALVIGRRSFGKGSVQNVIPIADQTCKLKLTSAYWYLPSGRCLHKKPDAQVWGVEPAIEIKLTPEEVLDVMELRRDSEIIKQPSTGPTTKKKTPATQSAQTTGPTTTAASKPAKRKYPRVDVQLKAALIAMQTRLASGYSWKYLATEQTRPAATARASVAQPAQTGPPAH